jgi:hypothetical protein
VPAASAAVGKDYQSLSPLGNGHNPFKGYGIGGNLDQPVIDRTFTGHFAPSHNFILILSVFLTILFVYEF